MKGITVLTGAMLAMGLLAGGEVQAATISQIVYQNATGFCQPALPVFEGNIRKRPTAVANEGTANAFVSCSQTTNPGDDNHTVTEVNLVIFNRTDADIDVTCSHVNSYTTGGQITPKTQTVPANYGSLFVWTAAELGVAEIEFANYSCNLPVGTDVGYGYYFSNYEIGS